MCSNPNGEHSGLILNNSSRKDIVISIVLSESTASLLETNAIHLEDILDRTSTNSAFSLNDLSYLENRAVKKIPSRSLITATSSQIDNVPAKTESLAVNQGIAYFSKSFSASETSINEFDEFDEIEDEAICNHVEEVSTPNQTLLLEPCHVLIRPLLAAQTTAHEDKIRCESNNIYISVMDSALTITSSGWVNFCRICHGGESMGKLIAPCRCRGSIALAHLECLEEWLKQSNYSRCELCQHRFQIVREPAYSIPWSVIVFLMHPGERLREVLLDVLGFAIYTPTAIASTYLLMVLCDSIAARNNLQISRSFTPHFLAFSAVFGMATIDFTYSSWLVVMLQRHFDAWKEWYQNKCTLKVILPPRKQRRHHKKKDLAELEVD